MKLDVQKAQEKSLKNVSNTEEAEGAMKLDAQKVHKESLINVSIMEVEYVVVIQIVNSVQEV